jgi:hypothetical protein
VLITILRSLNLAQSDRNICKGRRNFVVLRFIMFVCCLFDDAVSSSPDHTETNDWVRVNNKLERM